MVKGAVTTDQYSEIRRSQLRLFMSVDLEGSTSLKQKRSQKRGNEDWLKWIFAFIYQFTPDYFHPALSNLEPPLEWKILGDEIIYQIEITASGQTGDYLTALIKAIASWNSEQHTTRQSGQDANLLVKGAAWFAGFPVCNTLLPRKKRQTDFVGPAIDLGFRLSKYSTPKQLAVSVDVLWRLWYEENPTELAAFYLGRREMKGILDGKGYPLFVLEVSSTAMDKKERALTNSRGNPGTDNWGKMGSFCEEFIRETQIPVYLPFLPCERSIFAENGTLDEVDYNERLKQMEELLASLLVNESTEPGGDEDQASHELSLKLLEDIKTFRLPGF
jgi:hypothetical protein